MKSLHKQWRRPLLSGVAVLTTATVLVGWMHTPAGRRALHALGVPCPIDQVSTAQVVDGHAQGLAALRGSKPAPQRPALGLLLEQTTETDALAWAHEKKLQCDTVVRGLHYLRCRGVPAAALGVDGPAISEMWLSFAPDAKLIALNVYRRGLSPDDLDTAWLGSVGRLKNQLGPPSEQIGDASAAALKRADYATAKVQYRYSNYIATVTAANLPYTGLSLREQYVSGNS